MIRKFLIFFIFFTIILIPYTPSALGQTYNEVRLSNTVITKVGNAKDADRPKIINFVYYYQGDPTYFSPNKTDCHYMWATCAPTSLAMVISSFGLTQWNPLEVEKIYIANGWRTCGNGDSYNTTALRSEWLKSLGFEVQDLGSMPLDLALAKNYINRGYLIIGSVKQHAFVVDDVNTATNQVHLRDPAYNEKDSLAKGYPAGYWQSNQLPWTDSWGVSHPWYYAYAIKRVR